MGASYSEQDSESRHTPAKTHAGVAAPMELTAAQVQKETPAELIATAKEMCTDAQMHRCTDAQMYRCTDAQM